MTYKEADQLLQAAAALTANRAVGWDQPEALVSRNVWLVPDDAEISDPFVSVAFYARTAESGRRFYVGSYYSTGMLTQEYVGMVAEEMANLANHFIGREVPA